MIKVYQPSEHTEQAAFHRYLTMRGIRHTAVPLGGLRDVVAATRIKAEGACKGFPDMIVFLPDMTLAIEMKTRDGGRVSPEQKEWLAFLGSRQGWAAMVAKGAGEAIAAVERLLQVPL